MTATTSVTGTSRIARTLKSGFTMVELLVVIVILGLLSGLVSYGVIKVVKGAERTKREAAAEVVKTAIGNYYGALEEYPCGDDVGDGDKVIFGEVENMRVKKGNAKIFMELCGRDSGGARKSGRSSYLPDTSMFDIYQGGGKVDKLDNVLARGSISDTDVIGFVITMEKTSAAKYKELSGARAFAPLKITFTFDPMHHTVHPADEKDFTNVILLR